MIYYNSNKISLELGSLPWKTIMDRIEFVEVSLMAIVLGCS